MEKNIYHAVTYQYRCDSCSYQQNIRLSFDYEDYLSLRTVDMLPYDNHKDWKTNVTYEDIILMLHQFYYMNEKQCNNCNSSNYHFFNNIEISGFKLLSRLSKYDNAFWVKYQENITKKYPYVDFILRHIVNPVYPDFTIYDLANTYIYHPKLHIQQESIARNALSYSEFCFANINTCLENYAIGSYPIIYKAIQAKEVYYRKLAKSYESYKFTFSHDTVVSALEDYFSYFFRLDKNKLKEIGIVEYYENEMEEIENLRKGIDFTFLDDYIKSDK